jgi:DNA polymerase-3 subunit delta
MMSNYQVVIVKEAQEIKDIENLASYVESPLDSTILVVCYKYRKVDKRKSFTKLLEKKAVFFESARIYDNQVQPWIASYAQQSGYSIDAKASFLMAEFLGNDLSKIVNEVNKLIINIPKGSTITSEIVEKNIGISKDFNVFELQKALGTKNVIKANQIIKYFAENEKENPLVKVLPILYSYFVKVFMLHNIEDKSPNNLAAKLSVNRMFIDDYNTAAKNFPQEKLVRVFRLLKNYDLKCKGIENTASDGDLMKELIYKITH